MNASEIREMIKKSKDYKTESITIPEWGNVTFLVRGLSTRDRVEFNDFMLNNKETQEIKLIRLSANFVLTRTCFDEEGNPIFTEADIDELLDKNMEIVDRIHNLALKLTGIKGYEDKNTLKNSQPKDSPTT